MKRSHLKPRRHWAGSGNGSDGIAVSSCVWWISVWIAIGDAACAQVPSRLDDVIHGWHAYQQMAERSAGSAAMQRINESSSAVTQSVQYDVRVFGEQSRFIIDWQKGARAGEVYGYGYNSGYQFSVIRRVKNPRWSLDWLDIGHHSALPPQLSDSVKASATRVILRGINPYGFRLPEAIQQGVAKITRLEAVDGGTRLVFEHHPTGRSSQLDQLVGGGDLLLSPVLNFAVISGRIDLTPQLPERGVVTLQSSYDSRGFPERILEKVEIWDLPAVDAGIEAPSPAERPADHVNTVKWEFALASLTQDDPREYTLSYFGLPEPHVSSVSRIWWLLSVNVVGIVLLLAAVLIRRRSRAREGIAGGPPSEPRP